MPGAMRIIPLLDIPGWVDEFLAGHKLEKRPFTTDGCGVFTRSLNVGDSPVPDRIEITAELVDAALVIAEDRAGVEVARFFPHDHHRDMDLFESANEPVVGVQRDHQQAVHTPLPVKFSPVLCRR